MLVKNYSFQQIKQLLKQQGLVFKVGRFNVQLQSNILAVAKGIYKLYQHNEVVKEPVDFCMSLKRSTGIRSYIKPQVHFLFNGIEPFTPLPVAQAFPLFEWGSNWCVTNHYHECLVIHAAVVEKQGQALILPGQPGSGKSTLCAALVSIGGWRLLSDELTIVSLNGQSILPNPRPISLKNQSIDIMKSVVAQGVFSEIVKDTLKGTVGHLQAPIDSIQQYNNSAKPALIVYPKYQKNAVSETLTPLNKGESFIKLAEHSFNYAALAGQGFDTLAQLHEQVRCYEYNYGGDLAQAIATMESLL